VEKKVSSFIKENNLIIKEPIIVATSGGADSVSLLAILFKLGYKVILAHVNHNKREQSKIEEAAMRSLASSLDIPFELLDYHYDGEDNFHNDSHNARYNFFRELCDKYNTDTIATAHHSDDQLETILIKLMEGSNLYGYGGIPMCNYDGKYRIIRPLLCVTKEEIYNYAKRNNLEFFEDASNHGDEFLRNRLRHHVSPLLKSECSDLSNKAMEYSIQVHEAFQFIRKQSIDYLDLNKNKIDVNTYKNLDIALKKDIISLLLERYDIRKNNNIVLDILRILANDNGTKEIALEHNYRFVRNYNIGYIVIEEKTYKEEVTLSIDNSVIFAEKYKFYFSKKIVDNNAKYMKLCYNNLELPFTIRYKNDGDKINIGYCEKKVSRILIDNKVPRNDREHIPLVCDNTSKVLWIYGVLRSQEVIECKNNGDIYLICEELENGK